MASFKTVGELKDGISGLLSGLNLNNVVNLNGAIERSARTFLQKADVPEATGKESITLYSGVYDYPAPSSIFGGTLIDFRPQGEERTYSDYVYKKPIEQFDRTKALLPNGYMVAFEYVKGDPRIRVSQQKTQDRVILDLMASVTDSTNWAASGNASSLLLDETVFWSSPASLRFNLASGGSQGVLTKTKSSKTDLTDYEGVGVCFLATYIPSSVTPITSIELRIGNDSSNYFSVTATQGFLGAWTADEWQLTSFDLANATETGSVDITKIDYMQVLVNYNGTAVSNMRFGSLWISLPSVHQIIFGSAALFMASGQNPSSTITNDNDEIILNEPAYLIFEHECALGIAMQQGGDLSSPLIDKLNRILYGNPANRNDLGLYAMYRGDNPSEEVRSVGNFYND